MADKGTEIVDGALEIPQISETQDGNTSDESESEAEADRGAPAGYEQLREQRIKENLERMQKLGIADLSLKLNSSMSACSSLRRAPRNLSSHRKTPLRSPLLLSEPPRRSSRLKNETAVICYTEKVKLPKKERKRRREPIYREIGARPEIYTDEHEKLLGSTELTWKLFVDGCGADGRRIYDSVRGKSCHQCRQKTLGHRTNCSNCQMGQGQFCGDCLYIRYGENVLEANENPDWICPVCRGICNCSLCRKAKGWPPTGAMYRMITSLGYKSVAHYLVQTRRAPPELESEDKDQKTAPHSAKRSLAFSDVEVPVDGNEPHKKAISGQILDYGNKKNDELKAEIPETDQQLVVVSFSEHKGDRVAGRTRSSRKKANPNASEGMLKTNNGDCVASRTRSSGKKVNPNAIEGGEKEVVLSKKVCRKSKRSTTPNSVQDSIARRLRPRINRT